MEFLRVIEKVTKKIAPGRAPSFGEANVVKALEILGAHEVVGRIKLSRELGVGEGVTRTLVKHLKNGGLVIISRSGITLSDYGKKILSNLRSKISEGIEIPPSSLTVGSYNTAVLVRGMAHEVKNGLEQRDAAIKIGALGATTLVFRDNELTMPGVEKNVFQGILSAQKLLMSKLRPKENDVIIIGSAEDKKTAEFGAKMSAFELLKRQK